MKSLMLNIACGVAILGVGACVDQPTSCDQLPADQNQGNAGCLIVRPAGALMVQQRLGGSWAIPGGTAESGERAACTAARETREETGLDVQIVRHLTTLENGFHIYHCEADVTQALAPRDHVEIQAVDWQSAAERADLHWRFPAQRAEVEALIQQFE